MHISTHVLTLKVYKYDPLLFQRHPIISAMRTILLGDNVRPFFLKIWVIHFLPKAPFPKIDLFMFYDMILITILTKPPQRKCTERYSEDINSCTISEMLQMHNNMVGESNIYPTWERQIEFHMGELFLVRICWPNIK